MKRFVSLALVLIMVLGLFACFEPIDPQDPSTSTTKPTTTVKNPNGSGSTTSTDNSSGGVNIPEDKPNLDTFDPDELATFEAFFNPENHVAMHLDISKDELRKIQQDYEKYSSMGSKSPIYRMADLYITITTPDGNSKEFVIEQVGVRMKGNTSRTHFFDESSGMYNLIHFKVSFEETFDDAEYYGSDALVWTDDAARDARKNRTFATMSKIDMRWNRNDDPTYIRETYAYELYREFGILAPHTTLASLDIGSDHAGVWMIYEPIDKTFLEKNLSPEALGGDLYKLGWTNEGATFTKFKSYGVEDEDACQFFIYDLKTNKKTSDHSALKNLINTINSSSCKKESFASVVDVDSFLMFSAVSYMIGNPDDLRNNYNNCYIYFRADTGKMIIIPYDMDRGLGVNTWNHYGNGMTNDSPFQNYNVCGEQRNPLFKKSIQNGGFLQSEYVEALKLVANSTMLTNDEFVKWYNVAQELYSDDAKPSKGYGNAWDYNFTFDINKTCNPGDSSCMSFKDYINAKKSTLAQYIDGYTPDLDDPDPSNPSEPSTPAEPKDMELYLRGNFHDNNWSNQEQYKFKDIGDGVYLVEIEVGIQFKFKVYNNRTSEWYNTVDESCAVPFEYQGGNRNVQLSAGSYIVYFDSKTMLINIEQK